MKRRPLIAGNWKMNGTRANVTELLQAVKAGYRTNQLAELLLLPPYVFLAETQNQLADTQIVWGGQNVSDKEQGAFTGEISATMLRDYGCSYVIVGHSERRTLYHEDNQLIAQKFIRAQQAGLRPILCVGETASQHAAGQTLMIIKQQLAAVLNLVDNLSILSTAVIAYEPVWAIGTGKVATPEQAQQVHAAIRAQLAEYQSQLAEQMRIVYGGSVNASNAALLFAEPDIDGALVGGASLNAQQFLEITQKCHN